MAQIRPILARVAKSQILTAEPQFITLRVMMLWRGTPHDLNPRIRAAMQGDAMGNVGNGAQGAPVLNYRCKAEYWRIKDMRHAITRAMAPVLLVGMLLLSACAPGESRLGDGENPYLLEFGTPYTDVVMPETHADHWKFTAPVGGNISIVLTSTSTVLTLDINPDFPDNWYNTVWYGGTHDGTSNKNYAVTPLLTEGRTYYLVLAAGTPSIGATYTLTVNAL